MSEQDAASASSAGQALTDEERMQLQQERRDNAEFLFRPEWHDDGEKTFLGETGAWDGDDVVRIATSHPAAARFIAGKLFAFFAWDEPDEPTVEPHAEVFAATGGDIRQTIRSILTSEDFSSDRAYRAKLKSPVEFLVGFVRGMGGAPLGRRVFAKRTWPWTLPTARRR